MHFLGRTGEQRVRKAAEYLRRKQLPTGGWAIYEGGPAEVSSSVKAYFVLKLIGDDAQAPHMVRARETILAHGGIEACNSFTRIYLAIFGQCSWDDTPAVPPEIMLLPDNFRIFNIYKMSSWSRAIVVPLSVIWAFEAVLRRCRITRRSPSCTCPARSTTSSAPATSAAGAPSSRGIDHWLKRLEAAKFTPLRAKALAACEQWMHERLAKSDGLGAIFPPIINTILAFRCLGYAMDDPRLVAQVRELEKLELEDEETLHVQPCFSPVWDTALVIEALSDAGLPADDPILLKAGRWLLDHEVKEVGDWKKACPAAEPGGWYFEYANEWYPDTDDTAEVLTALSRVRFPGESEDLAREGAVARGQAWMLAMQNRDGGWGAFDKDCDSEVLTYIPFADHNAMIDPSCEDITGRALEAFHSIGVPPGHPAVRRGGGLHRRASSCPTGPGTGAGAATTSTARSSRCAACCTPARTCASRASRRPPTGSARARTPTAAGASCRTPTTTRRPRGSALDAFPDGVGARCALRDGRRRLGVRAPRHRLPARQAAVRRLLEGRPLDRHRLSEGLLPSLPSLCDGTFRSAPSRSTRARRRTGPTQQSQDRGGRHRRAPHRSRSELMRFPVHMLTDNIQHQVKHAIKGNKRYPFVLMLEPLYTCNLACIGCAVERHTGKLKDRLSLEKCIEAVDITGAPVVSICGGEPTIYPELPELVSEIIKRKRQIILCTNGLLLDENLYGKIAPNKRLTINVHLDGMRETHDYVCAREGVFDKAIEMIEEGVKLGHHMMANTTIFKETSMDEVEELCKLLTGMGVEGMLVSPGYQYESVDSDIFLSRSDMQKKFLKVLDISKKYRLTSTPMFLEFAAGLREYKCSPWSTVTYTPNGWKGPCYLIGKTWSPTYDEFWNGTDWEYWESRQDPLCKNCAMHSGFEASVVRELPKHPGDMVRMIAWNLAA